MQGTILSLSCTFLLGHFLDITEYIVDLLVAGVHINKPAAFKILLLMSVFVVPLDLQCVFMVYE